jgi:hypothetical protein
MTAPIFDLTATLKAKASIDADDTLAIRRIAWPDGRIDAPEADAIFDLNSSVKDTSREWVDFFVEAISTYVVRQQAPVGYVDDAKAAWLMSRIDSDGRVESLGELEALVKILEDATNVPEALKAYALKQIETIALTGTGPTRDGGSLDAGAISASEVKLLRRMLFAQASDGPAAVSRDEADMLFRIKDATIAGVNAPEWKTLFVQAVGNHLMARSNYRPLARDRAAQLESFMNDTHSGVGGFLGRMGGAGLFAGFHDLFETGPATDDHDAAVVADTAITPAEQAWLDAGINADKAIDPLEQALLAFIAEENGSANSV